MMTPTASDLIFLFWLYVLGYGWVSALSSAMFSGPIQ
jgi:hypothetical protein